MTDDMTQAEFVAYLLTLAKLIRSEAKDTDQAAAILENLADSLK